MSRKRRPTVARPRGGVTVCPGTAATSSVVVAWTPATPSVVDTTSGRVASDATAAVAAVNSSNDGTIRRRVHHRRRRPPPPRRAACHGGRPRRHTDVRRPTRDNGGVRRPTNAAATETPVAPHAAATDAVMSGVTATGARTRRPPRRRVRVSVTRSPERPAVTVVTDTERRPTVTAEMTRVLHSAVRPTWCCWPMATGRFTCSWSSAIRLDTSTTITSRRSPLRLGISCKYITGVRTDTAGVRYSCTLRCLAVFGVSWSIYTIF